MDYDIQLRLRRTDYAGVEGAAAPRSGFKVMAFTIHNNAGYELTKEYDSAHEALSAVSSALRKLTVETSGE